MVVCLLASNKLCLRRTVALECADNVESAVVMAAVSWLDGSTVNHQTGAVEACHGNQSSWHVLVTSWGEQKQQAHEMRTRLLGSTYLILMGCKTSHSNIIL